MFVSRKSYQLLNLEVFWVYNRERGEKVEERGRKAKEGKIERMEEENGKEKGWSEWEEDVIGSSSGFCNKESKHYFLSCWKQPFKK